MLLTKENWRDVVLAAIADLPDDVQASVGVYQPDDNSIVVRVACEPVGEGETELNRVFVRWWNTNREELEAAIEESPGCGIEGYLQLAIDMDQIDLPVISVDSSTTMMREGLFPDKAETDDLKHMVQVFILDELFQGGGISSQDINKDENDCFVRDDGSYILDWQQFTND